MSNKFNLLLLHQPQDIHPRTWICLGGPKLRAIFINLEKEALKNQNWSREKLSREVAKRLICSHGLIKQVLQGKRKFYPIPIIFELVWFSEHKKKFLEEFKMNTGYLKVNSASAKPVKAACVLTRNLAKILGAFMADGSLSIQIAITTSHPKDLESMRLKFTKRGVRYSTGHIPSRNQHYISIQVDKDNFKFLSEIYNSHHLTQGHYSLELSDEYKDSVEAFIGWIKEEFGVIPSSFSKKRNAWRVIFSNKILARYLMLFFGVMPSYKTHDAFEPVIIRKSNHEIRKAFARGVLMFDGCVTIDKRMSLTLKSKPLINSITEIFKKDRLRFGSSKNNRRREYQLFTTRDNEVPKLLKYFEKNTQKYKLLKWLSGDMKYNPITKNKGPSSVKKVLKLLEQIKCCDTNFLKNNFDNHHSTLRTYLKILRDQQKIKLSNKPKYITKYIDENATVLLKNRVHQLLFARIKEKFKIDKNFAQFLGIHKATLSAWRLRKNRVPIHILKKMCGALDVNFDDITSKNIAGIDREIAEII